jgi:sulfate transport system substrate-binding protein
MVRKAFWLIGIVYLIGAAVWVVRSGFVQNQLLNVACDPTRELWQEINQAFLEEYEAQYGERPFIRQSHGGSGSQAKAVIDGLPADVVSLALWSDTDQIRKHHLMREDWETVFPNRSLPYTSTIVMVVRKGNPKNIRDWPDLARPDVQVITPNPKTSGNGKWSFLALWGSVVLRNGSEQQAKELVGQVFRQIPVMDSSARAATMTFAKNNIGDVHLTWENEAHLEVKEAKGELEIVYPPISILAEPHVAIVDAVVDRKGTRPLAEAYVKFLYSPKGQEIIAKHYHRPSNPEILARYAAVFPSFPQGLFTARQLAPNWDEIQQRFFAEGAFFDQIFQKGDTP